MGGGLTLVTMPRRKKQQPLIGKLLAHCLGGSPGDPVAIRWHKGPFPRISLGKQHLVAVTQTATPYLIRAALSGSDAVAIAGETANPIYSLIAKPEIRSFIDLKGRVVGLSLAVDTISISMRKLLALRGLGETDYAVKELVGTPVRFECLRRGECDAVPLGQPEDFAAIAQGYRRLGLSTDAVAAFQFQVVAARRA